MIDPLSPIAAGAKSLLPETEMEDCFITAALDRFILAEEADVDAGLSDLLRSAH